MFNPMQTSYRYRTSHPENHLGIHHHHVVMVVVHLPLERAGIVALAAAQHVAGLLVDAADVLALHTHHVHHHVVLLHAQAQLVVGRGLERGKIWFNTEY